MKILYLGHIGLPTGYARAGTDLCLALLRAGVNLAIRPLGTDGKPPNPVLEGIYAPLAALILREESGFSEIWRPDAIIVHTLPLDCAKVAAVVAEAGLRDVPMIAYTTWEAATVPLALVEALAGFAQVWVPSGWNQRVFALHGHLSPRVRVVPHGIPEDDLPRRLGLVEEQEHNRMNRPGYRFYWSGAWTARKNPAGLLRAYAHAFTRDDDVALRIHSAGLTQAMAAQAVGELGIAPDELPRIEWRNRQECDDAMWRALGDIDCYVTASRGEAWNYTCFDAVVAGRAAISPMDGCMEYIPDCFLSINTRVQVAHLDAVATSADGPNVHVATVGAQGLSARELWSEPDLAHVASTMIEARDTRLYGARRDEFYLQRFGLQAMARTMLSYLQETQ